VVKTVVPKLSERATPCADGCHTALEHALISHADARDPELLKKLDAVAGRVL
jgi:5'-methylthioadenosine phosphorylase